MTTGRFEQDATADDTGLIRRKRALYRAQHRGTKEMDWMLGRFAEAKLAAMTISELQTFEQLVDMSDPDINTWLLQPEQCPHSEFSSLITDIRSFNRMT